MKRLWLELGVIFLLSLTPLLWFREGRLINGADINFPLDPATRLVSRLNLYDPTVAGGLDMSGSTGSIVFHGFQALLQQLGLGLVAIEQVQFVFWFLVTGLAFYIFAKSFEKYLPVSPLVGVLFWQFNPYRIATWTESNVATLAGLTLLPAAIGLINFVAQRKISQQQALLALAGISILSAGLGLNPPVIVVVGFAIGLYLILAIRRLGLPVRFAAKVVLTTVGISAFWLYPTIASLLASSGKLSAADLNLLDWVEGLSKNTSLWNVARLQGAWDWYEGWQGEPYITYAHYYRKPLLVLLSLIPVGLVIGGLSTTFRNKKMRIFAWFSLTLMVIGLALGMGTHEPMRQIFTFLKDHVPFFWIFRSPWYKFTLLTVTAYSLLIAVAAAWIALKLNQINRPLSRLVPLLISLSFVLLAFPLVTGALFPKQNERKQLNSFHVSVPYYVFEMAEFINQLPDQAGLVMLPQESAFNYSWGYGSAGDITNHLIRRPIFFSQNFTPTGKRNDAALTTAFYRHLYAKDPRATALLGLLNVKYLLHKRDSNKAIYNDVDDTQFIKERLALLPDVEFVKNFGMWDLWQLRGDAPEPIAARADPIIFNGSPLNYLALVAADPGLAGRPTLFGPDANRYHELSQFAPTYIPLDLANSRVENDEVVVTITIPEADDYELVGLPPSGPLKLRIADHTITPKVSSRATLEPLDRFRYPAGATNVVFTGPSKPVSLIQDPAFKQKLDLADPYAGDWQFIDASEDAPGAPSFEVRQDGSGAAITSRNHILGFKQTIPTIDPDGLYLISFDYEHISGNAPEFGLWQIEANFGAPSGELSKQWGTQHYESVFTPDPRTRRAELYFYARGEDNEPTSFKVNNVRLVRLTGQSQTFFLKRSPANVSQETVPATLTNRNATKVQFTLGERSAPVILFAPVAYGSGWQIDAADVKPVEVNGFGSGFLLDPGPERRLTLTYSPRKRLLIGSSLSLLTVLFLLWPLRQKKR